MRLMLIGILIGVLVMAAGLEVWVLIQYGKRLVNLENNMLQLVTQLGGRIVKQPAIPVARSETDKKEKK